MTALPHPQRPECIAESGGQPRRISQVGQQPGTGMANDPPTAGSSNDLRTRPGSLHLESALRAGSNRPSASPIFPAQRALPSFRPATPQPLSEGARLGLEPLSYLLAPQAQPSFFC